MHDASEFKTLLETNPDAKKDLPHGIDGVKPR
jgi:hypothetical protein